MVVNDSALTNGRQSDMIGCYEVSFLAAVLWPKRFQCRVCAVGLNELYPSRYEIVDCLACR